MERGARSGVRSLKGESFADGGRKRIVLQQGPQLGGFIERQPDNPRVLSFALDSSERIAEVDRSYVGRIERGDNNAAVLTLARLAAALDLTVAKPMQKAGL